ncbi:MAG: protein translocase subunit SecF [Bacteroidetes bacterium]|nr:protein translocase subunit SecF [Bacteroidota bacterium]MCW5894883.1 protein translocase subunit SecF [Bacteroidota bacterium]
MRIFGKTTIDFMAKRNFWFVVSGIVILTGMVSLFMKGLDYGIDFLGGTELVVRFDKPVDVGDVRTAMLQAGLEKPEIKTFGSDRDILVRTTEQGFGTTIGDKIREGLLTSFPDNAQEVTKEDKIGPKIGAELRRDALYAVIASLIAITIYVAFRFKWIFGVGAVVALFHDVLVTLGVISIFDGITPGFYLEIDQNMIAAFLTLVGLSVNDSVVIFDRIRENSKIFKSMGAYELINKSLNETLSRTIITSGTIFVVLVVLLIFGGEVNRGFAFALTIGIITGTYSSIYIASATVLEWSKRTKKQTRLIG